MNDRFEKSYHHRNHIYIPSRLDKEQTHNRKTGKSGNASRLSTSKAAVTTEIHDKSPRHSTTSASASKQQSAKAQPTSPSSDKKQQTTKNRSKSPPNTFDQPIRPSSMSINIDFDLY